MHGLEQAEIGPAVALDKAFQATIAIVGLDGAILIEIRAVVNGVAKKSPDPAAAIPA